jgi:hypothetical protein
MPSGAEPPSAPTNESVAVHKATEAREIVELALEIGEAQIGKIRRPAAAGRT